MKKKLGDPKSNWADDLSEALWAYRTTKRTPTKETPCALAFRTEAVIPVEVGSCSFSVETFQPETNDEGLKVTPRFAIGEMGLGLSNHGNIPGKGDSVLQQEG